MIAGPQLARNGMTVHAETTEGGVRMAATCLPHAEAIAAAVAAGRPVPSVPILGSVEVRGQGKLRIKPTACLVAVVTTPLDGRAAVYRWLRLPSEIAASTGGPLIECGKGDERAAVAAPSKRT